MATISPTITDLTPDGSVVKIAWAAIGNADTPSPVPMADYADRSVEVGGTFGGTTVTIQGSNSGTNYYGLYNAQGTAISLTAAGLKQIVENVAWMKPVLTGGSGSAIDVTIIARRASSLRN